MAPLALSDEYRQSLVPGFLYSSKSSSPFDTLSKTNFGLQRLTSPLVSKASPPATSFMIPAPSEKIVMFSPAYYGACTVGGILSCGLTHMTVTPLDLVKCNMQRPIFTGKRLSQVWSRRGLASQGRGNVMSLILGNLTGRVSFIGSNFLLPNSKSLGIGLSFGRVILLFLIIE